MDEACSTDESEERLVGIFEEKKRLGESRNGWESNTEMDLKAIEWENVNSTHLAQDRYQWQDPVKTVMVIHAA
jgi:hypothetical protein